MAQNNRPYVLWRRVSTKEQGDSELGLKAQVAIAEYFMKHPAEKVFTDVYTGTKLSECKNLWKAIKYCKENNLHLVIAKTDRFRNVIEALTVLDEIGEGNLTFCDLPTTDRTVLTIVFALWERQAIQGRINTKVALDERRKQLERNGSFISKSGRVCTHFGREKGCDLSAANEASIAAKQDAAILWRESSKAYKRAMRKRAEGWSVTQITADLAELYDENPDDYGTPNGCKPSKGTVSKWLREASPIAI